MVSSPSETLAYRTPACPRVGLSLAPFLLLFFFSFYSTLVSILVVAAVVIDDAGRHRAAGRVVISEAPDTNHRPPW